MKVKITRKHAIILTTILTLLMLAGCGSKATTEKVESEPQTVVKEEAPKVEEVETKVPEEASIEEAVVEEPVVEEQEEQLYIPEGIDMESTLPGEEWVASFVGKVTEPVVVIYNDNSGRKEVVQAGSEVTINPDEDVFAIYMNEDGMGETTKGISSGGRIGKEYYHIISLDSEKMRQITERPAKVTVMGGTEDWVIEFTIIVE